MVVHYNYNHIKFNELKSKKEIRKKFRNEVYKRDNYTCVYCGFGMKG
jgi:5-methylcytosine-specific restriction endonuclease McrA